MSPADEITSIPRPVSRENGGPLPTVLAADDQPLRSSQRWLIEIWRDILLSPDIQILPVVSVLACPSGTIRISCKRLALFIAKVLCVLQPS